jgi:hypothetical protein
MFQHTNLTMPSLQQATAIVFRACNSHGPVWPSLAILSYWVAQTNLMHTRTLHSCKFAVCPRSQWHAFSEDGLLPFLPIGHIEDAPFQGDQSLPASLHSVSLRTRNSAVHPLQEDPPWPTAQIGHCTGRSHLRVWRQHCKGSHNEPYSNMCSFNMYDTSFEVPFKLRSKST